MDKNTLSVKLVAASVEDASELYSWFNDERSIRYWGGPDMLYPLSNEAFIQKTKLTALPSYKLVNDEGDMVAFGQFYLRLTRYHFGRLAVSPKYRGNGLGRHLLHRLMRQATIDLQGKGYSLFVMGDNLVAKKLYLSLGYRKVDYPQSLSTGLANCDYMICDEFYK